MIELFMPLSQIDPSAMDYIDIDGMSKYLLKVLAVPASTIRGNDEVSSIRQQRQDVQESQEANQEAIQFMEAAGQAAPAYRALEGQ
jgi:hypothetical protein